MAANKRQTKANHEGTKGTKKTKENLGRWSGVSRRPLHPAFVLTLSLRNKEKATDESGMFAFSFPAPRAGEIMLTQP
jgi:hypothetical protein